MQHSAKGAAAHTVADLDAMEDKLRRLGLDVDHAAGFSTPSREQSSEDYLRRIRAAKAEKQQAQYDRMARQAVAAEKHQTVRTAAASACRAPGTPSAEDITAADRALLSSDTAEAAVRVRQDFQKSTTQQLRAERMLQSAQEQRQHPQPPRQPRVFASAPTAPAALAAGTNNSSKELATRSATAATRAEAKRRAITPWCAEVTQGLVELAMQVSDHRHLPATGLAGRPVYRLRQDLGVTQWRGWVEEFVFARAAAADTAAEAEARAAEAAEASQLNGSETAAAAAAAASAQAAAEATAVQREAMRCVEAAAQAQTDEAAQAQQRAVAAVLSRLQAEVGRQRRAAEEAMRREADEPHLTTALATDASGGGGCGDTTQARVLREEVLPGWAQRMPPAGCFVYGDDLSGARLLADTVELCVQHSLHCAQHHSGATAGKAAHHNAAHAGFTASDSAEDLHRGPNTGDELDATMSNVSIGKAVAAAAEDPFAHFTATEIGVEGVDKAEGGLRVTYVTPKTLTGTVAAASGGGDGRRVGSASRSPRSQMHGSPGGGGGGGGATAGGPPSGTAAGSSAGGGGGGGSAVRVGRRASVAPVDKRHSADQQLAEAAVRELVRVHRHNLGALVGSKIPAWARAAAAASPTTMPDGEAVATEAARVPLQTLFLVGFPDSASFAEYFADRLRTATAAAETELLEAEARRRAAEQQAVATAAADTTSKPRTPSTKNVKAAASPSRQKGSRTPKAAAEAEEGAVSAMAEQLRITFALPPLSVAAVFLNYDVATRQRRLEEATFLPAQQSQQPSPPQSQQLTRGMSDSTEEDILATTSAGAGSAAASAFQHPVYHPWRVEEREADMSRAGSFRRPVGTAAGTPASAAPPSVFPYATTPPSGFARAVDAWSVPCLRSELEQQDARQHQQRQAWITAVTLPFVKRAREAAAGGGGDLRGVPASFYAVGKRRDKTSPGSAAQEGDRSSQASGLTSFTIPAVKTTEGVVLPVSPLVAPAASAVAAESGFKSSPGYQLPRALFFARVLDVSDMTAPTVTAVDAAADAHALGQAVWRSSIASSVGPGGALASDAAADQQQLHVAARAVTVDQILTRLHLLCRPAGGRALSSDVLLPHQLPEPFRLGDYRLPDTMCARLRQVHDAYSRLVPEPASVLRGDRAAARQGGDAVLQVTTAALQAEAEAWAAVLHYAENLLALLAHDIFLDEGTRDDDEEEGGTGGEAHNDGQRTVTAAGLLNSTARFTSIDRNYAQAKDAIAQLTTHAVAHIQDSLVLLLRLSIDVCVAQLAAAAQVLCAALERAPPSKTGCCSGGSFSAAPFSEDSVEAQLLATLPRLTEETARKLLAGLRNDDDDAGGGEGGTPLLEQYWADVKQASVNVLTQYLQRRAREQASAEGAAAAVVDVLSSDDLSDGSSCAAKPAAHNLALENARMVVEVLLQHATAAPGPITRLMLLLQELQHKTQSLRTGADAWVELLYHDMLAAQSGNTTQTTASPQSNVQPRRGRRPQSVEQLADGPPAMASGGVASAGAATQVRAVHGDLSSSQLPQPSRWRCGGLEVFLATMPQPDAAGFVTATAFQRGLLMNQLPRIWRFLPDCTTALAARVHYTVSPAPAGGNECARRAARPSFPDTALDAYLVFDCPCRATRVPFLTAKNVQSVCRRASDDGAGNSTHNNKNSGSSNSSNMAAKATFVHLQLWLIDVAFNRCCFCEDEHACGAQEAAAAAAALAATVPAAPLSPQSALHNLTPTAASPAPCATRRVIRPPSSRALRQVVLSLPAQVLAQASALGSEPVSFTWVTADALPAAPQMGAGWTQTQWWWRHDITHASDRRAVPDDPTQQDVAICWCLWRILLRPSPRGVDGETRSEKATTPPPPTSAVVPSLLSLLRLLLVGKASEANPLEERVRRGFHCLAALRCVRDGDECDGDVPHATAIEDDVALTKEEVALLGELLEAPVPEHAGGEATRCGATTAKGMSDLLTDLQLLQQVEGTEEVTLPLLLSSRWAQLMLAAHF